ncbi:uncharacterized protein OCT59_019311 [Rhizophagus irregularis]|uniref:uncharacterized protein n=1 Tax=Rhizophagus irregularis TaxID=588596 RepID=UPI0033281523|nr:hypothetical protein OCT59_019311 [Rhizophagus irregularis]
MSFAVKFALLRRVPRYGLFILGSMRGILMFSRRGEGKPSKRSMETFRKCFLYPFCRIGVFGTLGLLVFDFGSGIGFSMLLLKRGNEMMVPDVRMMETTGSGHLDNGNRNELVPDVWIMEIKMNQFSPASTLASDIRYMNELEVRITHGSLDI